MHPSFVWPDAGGARGAHCTATGEPRDAGAPREQRAAVEGVKAPERTIHQKPGASDKRQEFTYIIGPCLRGIDEARGVALETRTFTRRCCP